MNFFIISCDSYDLPPKEHSLNTRENKYGPRPTYLGVHLSQIVQDTVQIKLSCTKNNMFSWLFNLWNRIKNQLNQFVANIKSDWKKKTLDTLRDLEMKFDSWKWPVNIPRLGGRGRETMSGSHGFQGEWKMEQSSPTEYKGGLHTILPISLIKGFD